MSMATKQIDELVQELPPDVQMQVRDFVEFLLIKHRRRTDRPLRQDWAGALRAHREEYTSLELQRKASEWRGD